MESEVSGYGEQARRLFAMARQVAQRFDHPEVGDGHLLMAVTLVADDDELAGQCLAGVDADRMQQRMRQLLDPGVRGQPREWSVHAKGALHEAVQAVRVTGADQLGAEHLLWGLVTLGERSITSQMLRAGGVTPSDVLRQLQDALDTEEPVAADGRGDAASAPPSSALETFSTDLVALAAEGALDPLIGRDHELDEVVVTLSRRGKSNPMLVGPAGVGKTAIVEGLAQRIAAGTVPAPLDGRPLRSVDVGLLTAGARHRGDFEERVTKLVEEAVDASAVLFVDEAHVLLLGGGVSGAASDGPGLADQLKPWLASGELSMVGATTADEYQRVLSKDPALQRRFRTVRVDEPDRDEAVRMVTRAAGRLASHHRLRFSAAAPSAAVDLTVRHLPDRQLPDKALDVLDDAAAARAVRGGDGPVTVDEVAAVVSDRTGVPVASADVDAQHLSELETRLGMRVVGQGHAVEEVARLVRRTAAGFDDPTRPLGALLFVGPSGVGKSELAAVVADEWFAGQLVRVDMSELMEAHASSKLVGAPPGYAGHDDAGLLERVRRTPHAVVLLDEVDKAHPQVLQLLLQMLEEGVVTDGSGRRVDFRDTLVVMTANDPEAAQRRQVGFGASTNPAGGDEVAARLLSPELRNRLDAVVAFAALDREALGRVVDLRVGELADRAADRGVAVEVADAAREVLVDRAAQDGTGRAVRDAVRTMVEEPLADRLLGGDVRRVVLTADGGQVVVREVRAPATVTS